MIVTFDPDQMTALQHVVRLFPVFLYIGPDQIMPLTSILGAAVGVVLMFWNRLVGFAHRLMGRRAESSEKPSAE